jgi:hypothetical protein
VDGDSQEDPGGSAGQLQAGQRILCMPRCAFNIPVGCSKKGELTEGGIL